MRFIEVDSVPEKGITRRRSDPSAFLKEFVDANIKFAVVDFCGEYCSAHSARNSIEESAKVNALPISVVERGRTLYLIRTDM